ncbi:hypothetical protein FDB42_12465 [Clostridium botulinum]|nr:hypothetical protein [Clostridium botulinum]NFO40893.1 hypothetical protein [Clostridium botulinum]
MGKVITMKNVRNGNESTIAWKYEAFKKDGSSYPLKIWENLECLLEEYDIELRYNQVSKEIVSNMGNSSRNTLLTDIYSLNLKEFLNLSREETANTMIRIAEKNSYNPFVDKLKEYENSDYSLINSVFDCIILSDEFSENYNYYYTLFVKWCLNVVKLGNNTLEKEYRSSGVLVLQGGQGCYKSTFASKLIPYKELYKGDKTLDPEKTDSIIQNTNYILVEWGELDSTLKGEQSKLKQFITSASDEYRSPYARFTEKHPRLTSYIGTVNKVDFLKDETGSRRFWIIPVQRCDIEKMDKIDMKRFWGAVYSLWKRGNIKDYLEEDERARLDEINARYNYKTDISYIIEEKIRWDMPKEEWEVYGITEISNYLLVRENKSLKIELEKKGLKYTAHRNKEGKLKKGFKLPRFETKFNL